MTMTSSKLIPTTIVCLLSLAIALRCGVTPSNTAEQNPDQPPSNLPEESDLVGDDEIDSGDPITPEKMDSDLKKSQENINSKKISFAHIKQDILDPHCISCHTGKHNAYVDYNFVKLALPQILARISSADVSKRMPQSPASPLSPLHIDLLNTWHAQGAPEFNDEETNEEETKKEPEEELIAFSTIKEDLLSAFTCLKCHPHYEDENVVIRERIAIAGVLANDAMPLPPRNKEPIPVDEETKKLFLTWVAEKNQSNADATLPDPSYGQDDPNWSYVRNNILGRKCILCHNAFADLAPADFSTYKAIEAAWKNNPDLFQPDDPINSHFIGSILGRVDEDEFFFDPMPFENIELVGIENPVPKITDKELEILLKWIKNSLPQ